MDLAQIERTGDLLAGKPLITVATTANSNNRSFHANKKIHLIAGGAPRKVQVLGPRVKHSKTARCSQTGFIF